MSPGIRERRNVVIASRRTSVSLERFVWDAVSDICDQEGVTVGALFTLIDERRGEDSLASALRVFALTYFRLRLAALGEEERIDVGLEEPMVMRPVLLERVFKEMASNRASRRVTD